MSVHIMGIFHLPVINNVSRIVVKDRVEKKVNKIIIESLTTFIFCLFCDCIVPIEIFLNSRFESTKSSIDGLVVCH